ncbi:MAG: hypothetical protein MJ053_01275 [Elusimicrobiaceae bacterium]|nr:hypothetical protein [Elusimicrobiaceae bacterium]
MIYFSHRGKIFGCQPGNVVPNFVQSHKGGARRFELDVHLLKDGQLAVHHDYFFLCAADQQVQLAGLTAKDLKKYPLYIPCCEQTFQVPLLTEVLPVVAPELELLNIELKNDNNLYPGIERALLNTLAAYPQLASKILFSSFDYETLKRLRALAPQARLGLLTRAFDVNKAVDLQAESVHLNWTRFTPQIATACHEKGLKVYLYTVNEMDTARRLEQEGADGIFTDEIDKFL